MRHRRHDDRRCGRSGRRDRQIPRQQRRSRPLGDPLLVLRLRNHRHGPADAQSHLGLQQDPASGSRLPRLGAGRTQPERAACIRHLRLRSARAGRQQHHPRRGGKTAALRPRGRRRHGDARQILPLDRLRVDGHRRFDARSRLLPGVSGHAQRSRRLLGDRAPHRTGHL